MGHDDHVDYKFAPRGLSSGFQVRAAIFDWWLDFENREKKIVDYMFTFVVYAVEKLFRR